MRSRSWCLVQRLGSDIVAGRVAADALLTTEHALADENGMSRTSVREAVKMLEGKGLLAAHRRIGVCVRPAREWNLFDPQVLGWIESAPADEQVLDELSALRRAVEPDAAALAAGRRDPADIDALRRSTALLASSELPNALLSETAAAFHGAVLTASGNRFFARMRDLSVVWARMHARLHPQAWRCAQAQSARHSLVAAVETGDCEGARAASRVLTRTLELGRDAGARRAA